MEVSEVRMFCIDELKRRIKDGEILHLLILARSKDVQRKTKCGVMCSEDAP